MATRLSIVSDALAHLGLAPVDLEAEDKRAARIIRLYDSTAETCLSLHMWSWSNDTIKLDRIDKVANGVAETENWPAGYMFAHAYPGNFLDAPRALYWSAEWQSLIRIFSFANGRVFTNHEDVWARGRIVREAEDWPLSFVAAFTLSLTARLAITETEDRDTSDRFYVMAHGQRREDLTGGMFGRLIAQDLAANPPDSPLVSGDPLTEARHAGGPLGGAWWGGRP